MAFTLPHFTCIVLITLILLSFCTAILPVSADDPSYTSCPYPCLPAPVIPVTNCPPPPPPPLPQEPVTGYWSYPPPPPSEYNPYFPTPNSYSMKSAPPPPNPMLPWYPWYYYQKQSTSVSKGNCVFPPESIISRFNVVLVGIYAILMIV